jgi:hypothetical protein
MIFILFDYKCFVIFKNSEANFVTAIELAYIYKKMALPYTVYSIVAFRPFCFLMFAHAQCKFLEFLAMGGYIGRFVIEKDMPFYCVAANCTNKACLKDG